MKAISAFFYLLFTFNAFCFAQTSMDSFSSAVFQVGGLNSEGTHPTFFTHAPTEEIATAMAKVYSTPDARNSRPEVIHVLVPDTLPKSEALAYRAQIERQFFDAGLRDMAVVLISVPVVETLTQGNAMLALEDKHPFSGESLSSSEQGAYKKFFESLRKKLSDLKSWASHFVHWRHWKSEIKSRWHHSTSKEKDKALLTIFGAARGIPGVAIYANDAGGNVINVARMVIAYAADIFFTVAPQKIADFPTKLHFPDLKDRTQQMISWGASFGLMALGYAGTEIHPGSIHFQLSQALPFLKEWFDKNIELKSFIFNYSLSLGIPLTFLTLGYFAKGGASSGTLSPFDVSFLMEFAGLQVIDGLMGMFGNRGARVLGAKGHFSGRQENLLYSLLNVLGQMQGLSVATGHTVLYKSCLVAKTTLQGLTFFISRVLAPKAPALLIFHSQISSRDRDSYLYSEGIMDPNQTQSLDQLMSQIAIETTGPSGINRWLGQIGALFKRRQWRSEIQDVDRTSSEGPSSDLHSDQRVKCMRSLEKGL